MNWRAQQTSAGERHPGEHRSLAPGVLPDFHLTRPIMS